MNGRKKVLLDASIWWEISKLASFPITLKAFRWGPSIVFSWQGQRLAKINNENHHEKLKYLKYLIDAHTGRQIDLVATKIAQNELSREGVLNVHYQFGWPRVLDPNTDEYMYLLNKGLLPDGYLPTDFYTWELGKKKDIRLRFIENFEDDEWQKFRADAKIIRNHLTDAFIYWQCHVAKVDYLVAKDGPFKDSNVPKWQGILRSEVVVCSVKECVEKLGLEVVEPSLDWLSKPANILHQQRVCPAGIIMNTKGGFFFLKALLKFDLGYTPPKDRLLTPTKGQMRKALINLWRGREIYGPSDFDVK